MAQNDEKALIKKLIDFLNVNGFYVWRQHNTGLFNQARAVENLTRLVVSLGRAHGVNAGLNLPAIKMAVASALGRSWERVPESVRGVADIIGWHDGSGRWVAVEVKIGADQLSDEQAAWMRALRDAGGEAYLVRDFDSFVEGFWRRRGEASDGKKEVDNTWSTRGV